MQTIQQVLEVQLDELDRPSWSDVLADAVPGAFGTGVYRFTGRVLFGQGSDDVPGRPFALARHEVEAADRPGSGSRALTRLCELDEQLQYRGWHKTSELGEHWWSLRYTRG